MTEWHLKSRRKKTGGIRGSRNRSDKKLAWKGGKAAMTLLSKDEARKTLKARASVKKTKLSRAAYAMVSDAGRVNRTKILRVKKNIANRHFERRQVITKGAIIEVEVNGERKNAIVTNRPGQTGEIKAKLVSGKIETETKKNEKKMKIKKKPHKKPKTAMKEHSTDKK